MATKKEKKTPTAPAKGPAAPADPTTPAAAHTAAEKDIERDPDLSGSDSADDLDEGELARRDNSDEEAFEELERPRQKGHQDRGSEK